MIKLFAIEDHDVIIVAGLRNLFRPSRDEIEIIGSATRIEEALASNALKECDLILLDLWLPNTDPLEVMKVLTLRFPGKPVLIYTSEESSVWKLKMMKAGARGFLNKNCDRSELKQAIDHVSHGGTWFRDMEPSAVKSVEPPETATPSIVLTPVERKIIELLLKGMNHREIAARLDTTNTVIDKKLRQLREKSGCKNTLELVKKLSETKII